MFQPSGRSRMSGKRSSGGKEMALKTLRKSPRPALAVFFRVLALGFLIGPFALYATGPCSGRDRLGIGQFARANGSLGQLDRHDRRGAGHR